MPTCLAVVWTTRITGAMHRAFTRWRAPDAGVYRWHRPDPVAGVEHRRAQVTGYRVGEPVVAGDSGRVERATGVVPRPSWCSACAVAAPGELPRQYRGAATGRCQRDCCS